jgi:hypothetical protein
MTHIRYWALTMATALAGAFIAIDRFAFTPSNSIDVAFGVAIAAAVFSLAATAVALLRENQTFSGTSALSAFVAAFTIIATRAFTGPTALWLAFAGGVALLLLSLRALALHETTVEQVVHQLELSSSGESTVAVRRSGIEISGTMRSWLYWLSHTAIALAGAFVVASTFIWRNGDTATVSPRWLAFGVGVGIASIGVASLVDRAADAYRKGYAPERAAAIALTGLAVLGAVALFVVMAATTNAYDVRWWAFGLAAGLSGVSLAASIVHELTTERVRHELEVAQGTRQAVPAVS